MHKKLTFMNPNPSIHLLMLKFQCMNQSWPMRSPRRVQIKQHPIEIHAIWESHVSPKDNEKPLNPTQKTLKQTKLQNKTIIQTSLKIKTTNETSSPENKTMKETDTYQKMEPTYNHTKHSMMYKI